MKGSMGTINYELRAKNCNKKREFLDYRNSLLLVVL